MTGCLPVGLVPTPEPTAPFSFRSICQLSVSPALFFNVKAKTALPCLIASFRSASLDCRASLIASKATEEGNLSAQQNKTKVSLLWSKLGGAQSLVDYLTVLETHFSNG